MQSSLFRLFCTAALLGTGVASAQGPSTKDRTTEHRSETIVLKQDDDRPQTIVEIANGTVIVNGDTVAAANERGYKKIVIDRNDDGFRMRDFGSNEGNKARLGVLTDPTKSTGGAYVQSVQPNSAAEEAGLKAGDKITRLDGSSIADAKDLIETIGVHAPGDTVKLTYQRDGKTRTATARLGGADEEGGLGGGLRSFGFGGPGGSFQMPNGFERMFPFDLDAFGRGNEPAPKLGLSVEDRADGNGVRVLEVKPNSPAANAGLKTDDVLTAFNNEEIASVDGLQKALRRLKSEKATLKYLRAGKPMSAQVVLPKNLRKKDL